MESQALKEALDAQRVSCELQASEAFAAREELAGARAEAAALAQQLQQERSMVQQLRDEAAAARLAADRLGAELRQPPRTPEATRLRLSSLLEERAALLQERETLLGRAEAAEARCRELEGHARQQAEQGGRVQRQLDEAVLRVAELTARGEDLAQQLGRAQQAAERVVGLEVQLGALRDSEVCAESAGGWGEPRPALLCKETPLPPTPFFLSTQAQLREQLDVLSREKGQLLRESKQEAEELRAAK